MTKRIVVSIEIESCQECPHYYPAWGESKSWCLEEDRETDRMTIPDWCPFNTEGKCICGRPMGDGHDHPEFWSGLHG